MTWSKKQTLYEEAKKLIEYDTSGFSLELIMSSKSVTGFAREVLEFDGFKNFGDGRNTMMECNFEKSIEEIKAQLDLHAIFIDKVAKMASCEKVEFPLHVKKLGVVSNQIRQRKNLEEDNSVYKNIVASTLNIHKLKP